jgi:hypothetical protein
VIIQTLIIDILELPDKSGLDIKALSRCFKSTSNAYKFYWFLAILDHVASTDKLHIGLDEISMRMLSSVWYPLDFYKLSFGKQDGFKELASIVSSKMDVDNSVNSISLLEQIEQRLPNKTALKLKHRIKMGLKRWVTFRFLSPFFEQHIRGLGDQQVNETIFNLSNSKVYKDSVPYSIDSDGITLNPRWVAYFSEHQSILRGFINWHLVKFLQKNNPNVVGLTEKLSKPIKRNLNSAKAYWRSFLAVSPISCIYSNSLVTISNFSLDHFIPWSYIAHDLLWNIVPTTRSVNSSKSDYLPDLSKYLDTFCTLQIQALNHHIQLGHNRLIEDYLPLLKNQDVRLRSDDIFKKV